MGITGLGLVILSGTNILGHLAPRHTVYNRHMSHWTGTVLWARTEQERCHLQCLPTVPSEDDWEEVHVVEYASVADAGEEAPPAEADGAAGAGG